MPERIHTYIGEHHHPVLFFFLAFAVLLRLGVAVYQRMAFWPRLAVAALGAPFSDSLAVQARA